ncbi:hypothetical protein JCM10207_002003 [Rhodosporidiobolus poonsookiae]
MRDANFAFPAFNRACICVSSGLYDRRALDAPAASLPLINSLHHLTNLTATSPRIREILAGDGGLERLVRILKYCAQGGPALQQQPTSLSDLKGKGPALPRAPRRSPFKSFAEYELLPSLEELRELEDADVGGRLLVASGADPNEGYAYSIPPALFLPSPQKPRHLLYTYTLAFQCIVNIGVRGSEAIRTRVVEAGALDVVVYVLERYLEDVERKRIANQLEWQRQERERLAVLDAQELMQVEEEERGAGAEEIDRGLFVLDTSNLTSASVSPMSSVPVSPVPPSPAAVAAVTTPTAVSRPLLTRLNVVAASSAAASVAASVAALSPGGLFPPSRVQTPDTVISMDEAASLTGDDNGSTSGQEQEDDVVVASSSSSSSSSAPQARVRSSLSSAASVKPASSAEEPGPAPSPAAVDDVPMDVDPSSSAAPSQPDSRAASANGREDRAPPVRRPAASSSASRPRAPRPAPAQLATAVPPPVPAFEAASSAGAGAGVGDEAEPHPLQFRDEDVLLSLQLLAYLSKYPHVRSVFHSPAPAAASCSSSAHGCASSSHPHSHPHSHAHASSSLSSSPSTPRLPPSNVFTLVEAFTYRPLPSDPFTPAYPSEVHYWAGVIMRNACRKDEQRGGIRQCANMRCGKWETQPREFAKCRRCRRAKYCSKTCQSEAWNQGHRYWCHKVASRRAHRHDRDHAHAATAAGDEPTSTPADSSAPASGAEDVATPLGDGDLPRRVRSHHSHSHSHAHGHGHARRRRRVDEDDDDEEDEFDAAAAGLNSTTPRASQHPSLPPALAAPPPRARDQTLRPGQAAGGAGVDAEFDLGLGFAPGQLQEPDLAPGQAQQGQVAVAGEDEALFALAGAAGMGLGAMGAWDGVGADEEQVAREMMGLGMGVGVGAEGVVRA